MSDGVDLSILFVCTHNSARSLIAEAILARRAPKIRSYSAGSSPKAAPHPLTLELLKSFGHDVSKLRSKSWDEFALPDAPHLDFIIAVCNQAAGEPCPTWPGRPMIANWAVDDPSAEAGGAVARRAAFVRTYRQLEMRIDAFLSERFAPPHLADASLRGAMQGRLDLVGEMMHTPGDADFDVEWLKKLH